MEDYQLLIDLHKDADRQGPGGDAETKMAIDISIVDRAAPLKITDIGCGTGASTLCLAQQLNAQITAVDFLPDFLEVLKSKADRAGLSDKISTLAYSMDNLPFGDGEFDVIWSEGAIYNIGFEKGVTNWNRYLKVGGILVVSEITWITASRPSELQKHWEGEYPEIDVASSKIAVLEKNGYSPIGYFVLPEHCWLDNYMKIQVVNTKGEAKEQYELPVEIFGLSTNDTLVHQVYRYQVLNTLYPVAHTKDRSEVRKKLY
ncbi:MAG: hypothetical protein RLZZ86_1452 [Cyanobacteriota bacterium]